MASVDNQTVEESIARIDSELASLKHVNDDQSTELYDRLDKVEKALRAAPAGSVSTTMPKETIARIDSELASLKQRNEEQSANVNDRLDKEPALLNTAPYTDGWMIKLRLRNPSERDELLGAAEYATRLGE